MGGFTHKRWCEYNISRDIIFCTAIDAPVWWRKPSSCKVRTCDHNWSSRVTFFAIFMFEIWAHWNFFFPYKISSFVLIYKWSINQGKMFSLVFTHCQACKCMGISTGIWVTVMAEVPEISFIYYECTYKCAVQPLLHQSTYCIIFNLKNTTFS